MKVLLLVTKGEVGGAQNFVANLARGLKNNKKEIIPVIACGQGDFLFDFSQKEGIVFHRFKNLQRSGGVFSNFRFLFDFFKYLRNNNFDIVHLNSSNALIVAMIVKMFNNKIKVIFTVHGLSILDPNYQANYFKKLLFKIFFKWNFIFVDKLVFVSQKNLDFLTKNNSFLLKKSYLIYNGAKVDFLLKDEARKSLLGRVGQKDNNIFLLGSIGRLAYPKNYEFILENFHEILKLKPEIRLVLIGDGPEREKYEKIVEEKGLRKKVFLLGEILNASRYLKGLDMFILPSIYEGLSISLIEALSSEIKVIASRVGGNEEVIDKKYCFELNNLNDFLRVFKLVIDSSDTYRDQEKFCLGTMIDRYSDLYENIL